MKKLISSVLVAVMAISINTAKADNISFEEAREAAAYFMSCYTGNDKLTVDDMKLVYQINNENLGIPASYFFNCANDGWVIIAGTTVVDPIIGFNADGLLNPDCFPANMRWWVENYSSSIAEVQDLDAENDYPDDPAWIALKTKTYKGVTKERQIILMSEAWNQGDDRVPTYNYYCPKTSNGGNRTAVTGCVATAMSQIFHYYRYPKKGQGLARYWLRMQLVYEDSAASMPNVELKYNFNDSAIFNYGMMPNVPFDKNGNQQCSDEEIHEIARLMYAAGVSVKMAYLPDGSGASSEDVPSAAMNYFKYKRGTLIMRNGTTDTTFVYGIRRQLVNRDVLYMCGASPSGTGRDAAGHAWVCDGYQEVDSNKYHMNWGWGGGANGFFNLGRNNLFISSRGYNFKNRQGYISGMVPPDDSIGVSIVDPEATTQLGSPYPNPAVHAINVPYRTQDASELVIYNIEGRPVDTYRVQPGEGEVRVRVDALPAGVYIYRMNSQTGKFLVQ